MKKSAIIGALLLIAGAICLVIEQTYFQYIDSAGLLRESFFMPLGFLCLLLGVAILAVATLIACWQVISQPDDHKEGRRAGRSS